MADFHRRDSFLKGAGSFGSFLDVNNLPKIPKGAFDLDYKIKEAEAGRPDILAGTLYEILDFGGYSLLEIPMF